MFRHRRQMSNSRDAFRALLPSFAVANFAMAVVVLKLPSHSLQRSHKFSSRLGEYYVESHNLSKAMVVQYGGQRPSNMANTTAAVVVVIRNPLSLLFCLQSKVFSEAFCTFDTPSFLDDGSTFKKALPAFAARIVRRRRDSRGVIFTKRSETDDGNKMANGPFLAERQDIQVSHTICSNPLSELVVYCGLDALVRSEIQSHHLQSAALKIHHSVSQTRPFFPKPTRSPERIPRRHCV